MLTLLVVPGGESAYPEAIRKARADLPKPPRSITCVESFEAACTRGVSATEVGEKVSVLLRLSELTSPAKEVGHEAWRAACLLHLAGLGVDHLLLPDAKRLPHVLQVDKVVQPLSTAIRVLSTRIKAYRKHEATQFRGERYGYVCGRPPYGYQVEHGTLVIDKGQAEAVRSVFKLLRDGKRPVDVVEIMRRKKREFWDHVKVRRILSHARLYTLGEYKSATLRAPVRIPRLAFLPASWADTSAPTQKASP